MSADIGAIGDFFGLIASSICLQSVLFWTAVGFSCASCCGQKHPVGFQLLYYSVALCTVGMNTYAMACFYSVLFHAGKASLEAKENGGDEVAAAAAALTAFMSIVSTYGYVAISIAAIILLGAIGYVIYMMTKPNTQVVDESNTMTVGMWVFVGMAIAIEIIAIICYSMMVHKVGDLKTALQNEVAKAK